MSTAHDENRLIETIPTPLVVASWRHYVIVIGTPIALFCCAISIGAWVHSGWQASLILSLIFWPFAAVLVFGTASGLHHNLRTQIPTIELLNDELTVRYGDRMLTAKVKDCHLHRGRATNMRLIGDVKLYCYLPVILIDFPPFWNSLIGIRYRPRNTVAVGYSTEMQDKWERALLQCTANN
jgi:hypothetical protein